MHGTDERKTAHLDELSLPMTTYSESKASFANVDTLYPVPDITLSRFSVYPCPSSETCSFPEDEPSHMDGAYFGG